MDRNTLTGLLLIVGIVLTWTVFFGPDDKDKKQNQAQTSTQPSDSGKKVNPPENVAPTTEPDDLSLAKVPPGYADSTWQAMSDTAKKEALNKMQSSRYGLFAPLYSGTEEKIHVKTDLMEFDISTKGGMIKPLTLLKYNTYGGDPLPVITDTSLNNLYLVFFHNQADERTIESRELYLVPQSTSKNYELRGRDEAEIVLRGAIDDQRYFDLIYKVKAGQYDIGIEVKITGMRDVLSEGAYDIRWEGIIPKTEKAMTMMRDKATLYYHQVDGIENLSARDPQRQEETVNTSVDWVAFRSQFFTQTLMAEANQPFKYVKLAQENPIPPDPQDPNSGNVVKVMEALMTVPYRGEQVESRSFSFYNGPLDYGILKEYDRELDGQIDMGWLFLKHINRLFVIPLFNFLEGFIGSYGLIIFLLALIIKMLLYPLTYRTYKSTAKMRVINQTPEIKSLEEKYKDNPTKLQQEKLLVYRRVGVNMFGGCLPMLLQYPFLISLFFFFPNAIQLRQAEFLWAPDLSTYDSILELPFSIPFYGDHVSLFTLLMTASIYIYTFINQKMQGQTQTNAFLKYFPYIMPLLFLGLLNNYSAGLSWYYLISNLISIAQTTLTKYFIDDKKILAQLEETRKKRAGSQKKGRMERWMEKQQSKQKEMSKARQRTQPGRRNRRR